VEGLQQDDSEDKDTNAPTMTSTTGANTTKIEFLRNQWHCPTLLFPNDEEYTKPIKQKGIMLLWNHIPVAQLLQWQLQEKNEEEEDETVNVTADTTATVTRHDHTYSPWLSRQNFGGSSSSRHDNNHTHNPTINYDYSYSRFTDIFPLDSQNALHFVVMSDRQHNVQLPLRALIHSLLRHVSIPVAVHVVTGAQSIQNGHLDWLDKIDSPYFQIHIYNYEQLGYLTNAKQLTQFYNFRSNHRSMPYTLVKPFVSNLPFPRNDTIQRVLMIDDDVVFWNDPVQLFQTLPANKLAMSCPIDTRRVEKYFLRPNQPHNGHGSRYCNSGMVHIPVQYETRRLHEQLGIMTNSVLDMFFNATQQMTTEYPHAVYPTSDQDIYNRVFATHENEMGNIPCQWHCDYNSCRKGPTQCFNCPEVDKENGGTEQCQAYHFDNHAYSSGIKEETTTTSSDNNNKEKKKIRKVRMDKPEQTFAYYFDSPTTTLELLYTQFWPRVGHCGGTTTPKVA
jgi:hypothetical protein